MYPGNTIKYSKTLSSGTSDPMSQKESEWEKRFDEKFGHAFDASSLALVSTVGGGTRRMSAELKSFIREAISTREKEIKESEWEERLDDILYTVTGDCVSAGRKELKSFIENLLEQEKEKSRKEQEKADWFGVTSRKMMKSEKEAIIEQERKRMSDEIGRLENDAEVVYSASGCDYSDHVDKESVLAIINKK